MQQKRRMALLRMCVIAATVMICSSLSISTAADKPGDKPADHMQVLAEKIKADKKLLIAENMELTESEAKKFWPVYQQFQDELFLLRMRTFALIKKYAESYEVLTNEKARQLLDEAMTIESLQLKLRQAYLPKFRKVLPDIKVARYYQMENKINAALMYELARNIPLAKQ